MQIYCCLFLSIIKARKLFGVYFWSTYILQFYIKVYFYIMIILTSTIFPKDKTNLKTFLHLFRVWCLIVYKEIFLCAIHWRLWYFVSKIVLTYWRKKKFYWWRKTFEIQGWRLKICQNFKINRKICSNSEQSVEYFKQNAFLTCSWRFLRFNTLNN